MSGTGGDDSILALDGNDMVTGLAGHDTIDLGSGDDSYGVTGAWVSVLEAGSDFVFGGLGNDRIWDWSGANTLVGGLGNDNLSGAVFGGFDSLSDLLKGDDGDDTLTGDNGDRMTGGTGADVFVVKLGGRAVTLIDVLSEA